MRECEPCLYEVWSGKMPLVRYFLYVGGALLALLIITDTFLPKMPVVESLEPNRPRIRLYFDQRWPERVVLDTGAQTVISSQPSEVEVDISPAPSIAAKNSTGEASTEAGRSTNTREAFAELRPNNMLQSANPKMPKPEYERKIARRHAQRMRLVWRQPYYGWSGNRYWW
jgi:hypothetical protein